MATVSSDAFCVLKVWGIEELNTPISSSLSSYVFAAVLPLVLSCRSRYCWIVISWWLRSGTPAAGPPLRFVSEGSDKLSIWSFKLDDFRVVFTCQSSITATNTLVLRLTGGKLDCCLSATWKGNISLISVTVFCSFCYLFWGGLPCGLLWSAINQKYWCTCHILTSFEFKTTGNGDRCVLTVVVRRHKKTHCLCCFHTGGSNHLRYIAIN